MYKRFLTSLSCVSLLAVLLWSLTTDKLGRRTILLPCQTLLVVILFVVGGLHFSGATATDPTAANAAAGTALVSIDGRSCDKQNIDDLSWPFAAYGHSPFKSLRCLNMCSPQNSRPLYYEVSPLRLHSVNFLFTCAVRTGPVTFLVNSILGIATW
jgi:hypothetical protein